MKKILLLTAITVISAMLINAASAQYFNRGAHENYAYATHYYGNAGYNRRIDELKREMEEDRHCRNWAAYGKHKEELNCLYRDANRGHIEARDGRH